MMKNPLSAPARLPDQYDFSEEQSHKEKFLVSPI